MKKQIQTLAKFSSAQLELVLLELANLREDLPDIRRFRERFAVLIPALDSSWKSALEEGLKEKPADALKNEQTTIEPVKQQANSNNDLTKDEFFDFVWISYLGKMLRTLWTEPDLRQKEWGVFVIRNVIYLSGYNLFPDPSFITGALDLEKPLRIPPPTPFEQALLYFLKVADRARYCANPECPAPFFFAGRKNQRYCSEKCTAPAQRELKRQWWAEHGEEWRAARQVRKSSKRGSSKGKSGQKSKRTTKKRGK